MDETTTHEYFWLWWVSTQALVRLGFRACTNSVVWALAQFPITLLKPQSWAMHCRRMCMIILGRGFNFHHLHITKQKPPMGGFCFVMWRWWKLNPRPRMIIHIRLQCIAQLWGLSNVIGNWAKAHTTEFVQARNPSRTSACVETHHNQKYSWVVVSSTSLLLFLAKHVSLSVDV